MVESSAAVTVVLAPAARVPPLEESVSHGAVFVAVQVIVPVPVLLSVHDALAGVAAPPKLAAALTPPAGVTLRTGAPTVRMSLVGG